MVFVTSCLGVSMGFHRMLSHRSFKAKAWFRILLAAAGCLSLQKGPIGWSATHRVHHRESDHEDDPHSPLKSFFWAHMGWLFQKHEGLIAEADVRKLAPDLYREPAMVFMERWYISFWLVFAALSMLVGYLLGGLQLGLSLFVWGSLARTVYVWHVTWFVNSVTHLFGYRNYNTADDSRNLWWVAVCTFGEGWHNNHHAVAGSANFGHKWWEFDVAYWVIALCHKFGWVEKMNLAPPIPSGQPVIDLQGKAGAVSKALQSFLKERRAVQTG